MMIINGFGRFITIIGVLYLLCAVTSNHGLKCMQCGHGSTRNYISAVQKDEARHNCQVGLIEPTICANKSASHCITDYYREANSLKRTVKLRKCGSVDDLGCTLYTFRVEPPPPPPHAEHRLRRRRHKFDGADASRSSASIQPTGHIELCAEGCNYDGCTVNSANNERRWSMITLITTICGGTMVLLR